MEQQPSVPAAEELLSQPVHDVQGVVSAKEAQGPATASYATAASRNMTGITPLQPQRKNSVLVYGKATTGQNDCEEILAADVELVATGFSRDATNEQFKDFIVVKGIVVMEIEKMTTFEQARTNTFRIKIKAA